MTQCLTESYKKLIGYKSISHLNIECYYTVQNACFEHDNKPLRDDAGINSPPIINLAGIALGCPIQNN